VWHTLAVGCAIAASAVGYYTLIEPLDEWRSGLVERSDQVRQKLAEGPKLRSEHAEQKKQLDDLLARVEQVNRRVPQQPREGAFLADLSRLADRHGVALEDFSRGEAIDATTHSVVTVSVRARVPHAGLCRLLHGVAELPRLAELTRLRIDTNAAGPRYPAEMTFALYYGMAAPPADPVTL